MEKVKHLKVLGYGDPERLGDAKLVRQVLIDMMKHLGMQPLGDPMVHDVPLDVSKLGREPFEDEGGITSQLVGFHTLSTSHVALHTWPLRKEFHLDIYSCRYFSKSQIMGFLTDVFHITKSKVSDLTAACEWD